MEVECCVGFPVTGFDGYVIGEVDLYGLCSHGGRWLDRIVCFCFHGGLFGNFSGGEFHPFVGFLVDLGFAFLAFIQALT